MSQWTVNLKVIFYSTMRQIKIWLLGNSNVQTYCIIIVLILTFIPKWIAGWHLDFFIPAIYLLLIIWVYYSILYYIHIDEDTDEEIILRVRDTTSTDNLGKLGKLTLLIFFGYNYFFIFGKIGVLFALTLITLTALFLFFISTKEIWTEKF